MHCRSGTLVVLGPVAIVVVAAAIALAIPGYASADQARSVSKSTPACETADAALPRTLADVLARLRSSARAEAVAADGSAAVALQQQAGTRPNPEVALELEDFTGSGRYSSFGESQTTLSLSQRIELGGQREQRIEVAERETGVEKARGVQELVRADVAAKQEFASLLARRERVEIAVQGEHLAREVLADARRRAEGGAGSTTDVERARVAAATASLEVSQAQRDIAVTAQRLAGLWGGDAADVACVGGELTRPRERAAGQMASAARDSAPSVVIAEAEVEVRRAEVAKAHADSTPDLAVSAGVRHLAGPDDVSVVAGLNLELPLFDRNTGNISAAEQRLFAAQGRARIARDEAASRDTRLREAVEAARQRAATLATEVIPSAERAFGALSRAWRDGAASSLEVLDARRTLVALRLERVEALVEFHRNLAALEGSLGSVSSQLESTVPDAPASAIRAENGK